MYTADDPRAALTTTAITDSRAVARADASTPIAEAQYFDLAESTDAESTR